MRPIDKYRTMSLEELHALLKTRWALSLAQRINDTHLGNAGLRNSNHMKLIKRAIREKQDAEASTDREATNIPSSATV